MYKLTINGDNFLFENMELLCNFIKQYIEEVHVDKKFHEYEFSINKE